MENSDRGLSSRLIKLENAAHDIMSPLTVLRHAANKILESRFEEIRVFQDALTSVEEIAKDMLNRGEGK